MSAAFDLTDHLARVDNAAPPSLDVREIAPEQWAYLADLIPVIELRAAFRLAVVDNTIDPRTRSAWDWDRVAWEAHEHAQEKARPTAKARGTPRQELTARPKPSAPSYNPWESYEDEVRIREFTSVWTPGYLANASPAVRRALQRASEVMQVVFDDGAHVLAEVQRDAKAEATAAARRGERRRQKREQARENEARRQLTTARQLPDSAERLRDEHERHVWALHEACEAADDLGVIAAARSLVAFVKGSARGRVRGPGGHAAPKLAWLSRPSGRREETTQQIRAALKGKVSNDTLQDVVVEYLARRASGDVQPLERLARLCADACRKRAREDALRFADSYDFSDDENEDAQANLPHLSSNN